MSSYSFSIEKTRFFVSFLLILTVNWFLMSSMAYATSLIGIELFTNQVSTNNSGSTYQTPLTLSSETPTKSVDFTLIGQALANVNLLTGKKQVVLVIPNDLVGKVTPNGKAKIEVDVLLSEQAPVVGTLLGPLKTVLTNLLNFLGPLVPNGVILSGLINRLFNLGKITYETDISNANNQYLTTTYTDGLGKAIVQNLSGVVAELNTFIGTLGLLGAILTPVRTQLTTLSQTLANPTPELLTNLADTAVLSNTKITFPTIISTPGNNFYGDSQGVSTQTFYMRAVKADIIDLNLFKNSSIKSDVFLKALKAEKVINLTPPTELNFGKHDIQTLKDETWKATLTGNQTETPVVGKFSLKDTTAGAKTWKIKVKQQNDWQNNSKTLKSPVLKVYGGELTYTGFSATEINYPFPSTSTTLELTPNSEKQLLELNSQSARGSVEFDLTKFELFVPKNQKKNQGTYQAGFVWTASNSP